MSESYIPGATIPPPRPAYLPRTVAPAIAADEEVELRFDAVNYIMQKDGFFNVEYSLKLPASVVGTTVRLALANDNSNRDPDRDRDHITRSLPSVLIPPRPVRQGRKGRTGVNLTEYQAKQLLWFMNCFNMWGKSITAYLVVYTVGSDGRSSVKVSNSVTLDCPLVPAYFGGFSAGPVARTRPLGQALNGRRIPYEVNACLLLNLDLFGISVWFFHSNKKLITATHKDLRRGLNCITFLDAAAGTNLDNVMGKTGSAIAAALGAAVILEGVLGDQMRAHFSDADRGIWETRSFILWWNEHCVIIVDGIVCEYSRKAGAYRETPVQEYLRPFQNSLLSLARI